MLGRGLIVGAATAGISVTIDKITNSINELDAVAKRARTAGLTTDFFQTLQVAAEEASVSQSLLDSSMIALTKRLGELTAGTGPLVTGLKGVDQQLLAALRSADSTEDAFLLLAEASQAAGSATDRARIANAGFGRSGVEMARILDLGRDGLEATARKARELGIVLERDVFDKSEESANRLALAGKQLEAVWRGFANEFAPLVADGVELIAAGLRQFTEDIRQIKRELGIIGKAFNDTFGASIQDRIGGLRGQIEILEGALASPFPSTPVKQLNAELDAARANLEKLILLQSDALRLSSDRRLIALAGGQAPAPAQTDTPISPLTGTPPVTSYQPAAGSHEHV